MAESVHRNCRPFVHLFRTDNGLYAYDVNTIKIVRLSEVVFELLQDSERGDEEIALSLGGHHSAEEVAVARQELDLLCRRDEMFSSRRPSSIATPFSKKRILSQLRDGCRHLILNVSEECNLRCEYCYYTTGAPGERQHRKRFMTWEIARRSIEFFIAHSGGTWEAYTDYQRLPPGQSAGTGNGIGGPPCIGFYGGEPLLNWPVVKKSAEYIRGLSNGADYMMNMTTNGTLLNPRIADFLVANDVILSVSIDGPKWCHDRYRHFPDGKGSFDQICSNLTYIRRKHPAYYGRNLSLLAVVAPPVDYRDLFDFFLHFDLAPRGRVRLVPVSTVPGSSFVRELKNDDAVNGTRELWREYGESAIAGELSLDDASLDVQKRQKLLLLRGMFDGHIRDAYMRTKYTCENQSVLPDRLSQNFGMCLPGAERLFVTTQGSLLPCERVPSCASDFVIGNIDTGFDIAAVMNLCERSASVIEDECVNCWNVRTCSIPCFSVVNADGIISREAKSACCEKARQQMHDSMVSMCSILEKNARAFDYMNAV